MLHLRRHQPQSSKVMDSPAPPFGSAQTTPNSHLNDGNQVFEPVEVLAVARDQWQFFGEGRRRNQQVSEPSSRLPALS